MMELSITIDSEIIYDEEKDPRENHSTREINFALNLWAEITLRNWVKSFCSSNISWTNVNYLKFMHLISEKYS